MPGGCCFRGQVSSAPPWPGGAYWHESCYPHEEPFSLPIPPVGSVSWAASVAPVSRTLPCPGGAIVKEDVMSDKELGQTQKALGELVKVEYQALAAYDEAIAETDDSK